MGLSLYKKKRDFKQTSEPEGDKKSSRGKLIFVVQKHAATRLHYDFRLELNGVLKSWAVPKGPSMNPADKRLAIMVEDHPFDYKDFEGVIPEGNYGAGEVIVWDNGYYIPMDGTASKKDNEKLVNTMLKKGDLKIVLAGTKLKGEFALVKIKSEDDKSWLLIKKKDEYATKDNILLKDKSVISKKTVEQLKVKSKKKALKTEKADEINVEDLPESPYPENVKPMLATLTDKPFNDDKWLFEIKFDGYRIIAGINDNEVELTSRNLNSYTEKFSTITKELKKIKHDVVLDGEVVSVDENNNPNFQLLQNFQKTGEKNILYYVFDILWYDGNNLENVPLIERKNFLKELIPKSNKVIYSDHIEGKGKELFKTVSKQGLEGIIGKKMQSKYYENTRTKEWLKIKTEKRQEAIICGYTSPRGSRKHFGSLILGIYKRKKLIYIGHTGTGFTKESLKEMYGLFDKLRTDKSPFEKAPGVNAPVTWLKPKLLCEVKFSEWTQDGIMRHPVYGVKRR